MKRAALGPPFFLACATVSASDLRMTQTLRTFRFDTNFELSLKAGGELRSLVYPRYAGLVTILAAMVVAAITIVPAMLLSVYALYHLVDAFALYWLAGFNIVAVLVGGVAGFLVFRRLWTPICRWLTLRLGGPAFRTTRQVSISTDEDGISWSEDGVSSRIAWHRLESVAAGRNFVLLSHGPAGFFIPNTLFADEADRDAFVAECKSRIAAGS